MIEAALQVLPNLEDNRNTLAIPKMDTLYSKITQLTTFFKRHHTLSKNVCKMYLLSICKDGGGGSEDDI